MSSAAVYRPTLTWHDCHALEEDWENERAEIAYYAAKDAQEAALVELWPDYSGDRALDGPEVDMFGRGIQ